MLVKNGVVPAWMSVMLAYTRSVLAWMSFRLADVYENFRKQCLKSFSLDPAHFYTAPSLTWSAALKHTKVKLQLLRDVDMSLFIDRSIVGGVSLIANKYAKANDPSDTHEYDQTQKDSYLKLWDVNNLYGYAMRQPLPTNGFEWVEESSKEHWEQIIKDYEYFICEYSLKINSIIQL